MNDQLRLLREYASHRRFVELIAGDEEHPESATARSLLRSTTEIAEGTLADDDTFAQCAVVWNGAKFASGIYVGGRIVLTASHVVTGIHPNMVSLGVSNVDQRFNKAYEVASYGLRAGVPSAEWDVAILVLKEPGPLTGTVSIGTTADLEAARITAGGTGVTVCGFGWGWPAGHPEQLSNGVKRSMDVPLSDVEAPTGFPENFFVAGDSSETAPFHNICKYDSGAPAFVGDSNDLTILGIASATFDIDAATKEGCGTKPLGIFSRVDVGRDWILNMIQQHQV